MKELIGKHAILKSDSGCLGSYKPGDIVQVVSVESQFSAHPLTIGKDGSSVKGYTHPNNLEFLDEKPKETTDGVVIVTIENLTIQGAASDVVQVLKLLK